MYGIPWIQFFFFLLFRCIAVDLIQCYNNNNNNNNLTSERTSEWYFAFIAIVLTIDRPQQMTNITNSNQPTNTHSSSFMFHIRCMIWFFWFVSLYISFVLSFVRSFYLISFFIVWLCESACELWISHMLKTLFLLHFSSQHFSISFHWNNGSDGQNWMIDQIPKFMFVNTESILLFIYYVEFLIYCRTLNRMDHFVQ